MLYILNIRDVICQLYFNETEGMKGSQDGGEEWGTDHVGVM